MAATRQLDLLTLFAKRKRPRVHPTNLSDSDTENGAEMTQGDPRTTSDTELDDVGIVCESRDDSLSLSSLSADTVLMPIRVSSSRGTSIDEDSEEPLQAEAALNKPSSSSRSESSSTEPRSAISDLSHSADDSPSQPKVAFPSTVVGSKKRSFNSSWYQRYPWLEYSMDMDAAFCFACRFFFFGKDGKE